MHTLAKRIHNITPRDVRLTFEDGSAVVLEMRSAEFFQEAFQAEGTDDDGTTYRLVTDGEDDPLVAAGSIVAKVARDGHVAQLAEKYGEVGSGYPSDSTTREFLREYVTEHGELPACARVSWKTSEDVLAAAEQSALDRF